jgi:hypothetical protein
VQVNRFPRFSQDATKPEIILIEDEEIQMHVAKVSINLIVANIFANKILKLHGSNEHLHNLPNGPAGHLITVLTYCDTR